MMGFGRRARAPMLAGSPVTPGRPASWRTPCARSGRRSPSSSRPCAASRSPSCPRRCSTSSCGGRSSRAAVPYYVRPADWEALREEEGAAGRAVPWWARLWRSGRVLAARARRAAAARPRAGARARLRPRPAQRGRRAGRRGGAGHGRRHGRRRLRRPRARAQRGGGRRRARGLGARTATRSPPAARGTSCWPPTSSTRARTSRPRRACSRACSRRAASSASPIPGARARATSWPPCAAPSTCRRVQHGRRGPARPAAPRAERVRAARASSAVRWTPAASKFAGSSQRSNAARTAGHSPSSIEYQAVSRLRPLTTMCWRNTPSKVNPKRSAARRERALAASHFHSRRRLPRPSKARAASRKIASVAAVRCAAARRRTRCGRSRCCRARARCAGTTPSRAAARRRGRRGRRRRDRARPPSRRASAANAASSGNGP